MKRGKPLQRKTPLQRSQTQTRRYRRNTGPDTKTRNLVLRRANGLCERCGVDLDGWAGYSIHHRRTRANGGSRREDTNSPVNLVAICGSGTTACHGWIGANPDAARPDGWRVDQSQDPAAIPIKHKWFGRVLLTPDGEYAKPEEGNDDESKGEAA